MIREALYAVSASADSSASQTHSMEEGGTLTYLEGNFKNLVRSVSAEEPALIS